MSFSNRNTPVQRTYFCIHVPVFMTVLCWLCAIIARMAFITDNEQEMVREYADSIGGTGSDSWIQDESGMAVKLDDFTRYLMESSCALSIQDDIGMAMRLTSIIDMIITENGNMESFPSCIRSLTGRIIGHMIAGMPSTDILLLDEIRLFVLNYSDSVLSLEACRQADLCQLIHDLEKE